MSPLGPLLDVSDKLFELGFRVGPLATLRFMWTCHPHLMGGGVVVNLTSGSALRTDPSGLGGYAAVKEAVSSLTRTAAVEWGPDGIRVVNLMPRAICQAWSTGATTTPTAQQHGLEPDPYPAPPGRDPPRLGRLVPTPRRLNGGSRTSWW